MTLAELIADIQVIIQDSSYTSAILTSRINDAVSNIAAGIWLKSLGCLSPPLPALFDTDTVDTTVNAYASMPDDYQRNLCMVADSDGARIRCPKAGNYNSFLRFLNQADKKDLSETGSVYVACVKGNRLYYQSIPTVAETLTVHFYRKPVAMALSTDTPDGLPDHLQTRLVRHYVCKDIFGEGIEDGENNQGSGFQYHNAMFYEAMEELVDFVCLDALPVNIASDTRLMWMDEEAAI
jgi:hypothetical protein